MEKKKAVLKGQKYVAPRAESYRIVNQGVMCASSKDVFSYSSTEHFIRKTL